MTHSEKQLKRFAIVDEKGKVIETYHHYTTAFLNLSKKKKDYFNGKLKIIKI